MNKMIKGSVAGATGIVLLMGGFGTYALWSDSAAVDADQIQSGSLTVESTGQPTWKDVSSDKTSDAWNADTDLMVPGDKVELTQPLDVTAKGKNLKVKLSVSGATSTFDGGLVMSLTYAGKSTTVTSAGTVELNFGPADLADLTAATDAVATFELPSGVDGNMNREVDLRKAVVLVEQVRP
jgi:alternate signal-mediated exported protein